LVGRPKCNFEGPSVDETKLKEARWKFIDWINWAEERGIYGANVKL
jgi:hypothetical protein